MERKLNNRMAKEKNPNEIIGQLITAVTRSKLEAGKNIFIIDLKLKTNEPADVLFKLESMVSKIVSVNIETKQLSMMDDGGKYGAK